MSKRNYGITDPAHYRWSSYRSNGLGQTDPRLTLHSLYETLGRTDKEKQANYRALFRTELDRAAIDHIRLALSQSQPMGNERFLAKIEAMTGIRREAKPRGRPRLDPINWIDPNGEEPEKYQKPENPNKRKGADERKPGGNRERNVGHPDAEEHSRRPKGQRGPRRGIVDPETIRQTVEEACRQGLHSGIGCPPPEEEFCPDA